MPLQVDADHGVEVGFGHVEEDRVAQEAGVADDDVDVAELLHGQVEERLRVVPVGGVAEVRDRLAAHRLDLVARSTRRGLVAALAVGLGADVVDHDARAEPRQLERVTAPEPRGSARDDRHFPVEHHESLSMIVPVPTAAPQHIVMSAVVLFVRSSSCSAVTMSREPVAPTG
jgi:hypothetical protein